jgi:L-threonylcarbamoyladenylate synthase
MKIVKVSSNNLSSTLPQAVKALEAGGIVVYPTETCYGLGVDAGSEKGVSALLEFKGKRGNKPVSVAVSSREMARNYVEVNEMAEQMYATLLPGPVTVISRYKGGVDGRLVSPNRTLGIRIPNHPVALELIEALGRPITATSANTSGQKQPYSVADFLKYTSQVKQKMVAVFLDFGPLPHREPSTVVDTTLNEPVVLRQGAVRFEDSTCVKTIQSKSEGETRAFGEQLAGQYRQDLTTKPLILALQGPLGAGKTQVVKGVARSLGIKEKVTSPTYTLMKEYGYGLGDEENGMLFHIDTWRLAGDEGLGELGFETLLKPGSVVAIEWLEKVKDEILAAKDRAWIVWVEILGSGEEKRVIRWFEE